MGNFKIMYSFLVVKVLQLCALFFMPISGNSQCLETPHLPKYHLIEQYHRSKLRIAATANYSLLTNCLRLAKKKKALAMNFSPPEAALEGYEPLEYTCEVLTCSEADGGLSLVNDTRYDYYSIYARPLPNVNSTCVPATGMFQLLQDIRNHSQAVSECRNVTGQLADVSSEQRTDALAQMLAGASVDAALVGLSRIGQDDFRSVNGDTLDCTTYRAWAPGHPKRNHNKFDCVVLTRHRTWETVPSKKAYPVLCELIPGGPYKKGSIFVPFEPQIKKNTNI